MLPVQGGSSHDVHCTQPTHYSLRPILSTLGCLLSAGMVAYPFYLVYWLGESRREGTSCDTYYGLWRIIHVSHLMLWTFLLGVGLALFPVRLEKDFEATEYRYVAMAFMIPIPFSQIREVKHASWFPGYVQINTTVLPFIVCPTIGAEAFINEHVACHSDHGVQDSMTASIALAAKAASVVGYGATHAATADVVAHTPEAGAAKVKNATASSPEGRGSGTASTSS